MVVQFIHGKDRRAPRHILKERLAKGEISVEEYERLRRVLKQPEK
ncbi:SHOCT domain-containing protein [Virgibacillus sediminis]|uniref:SHOCT domain-containing protein n=1 Tax=Virgibacillus sediminis TaxID=202260 RepID=A0ABV7A207_9BACI